MHPCRFSKILCCRPTQVQYINIIHVKLHFCNSCNVSSFFFATALTSNFQNSEKSRQLRNHFAHFVLLHFYHVAKTKQNPQKQHLKVREANVCQISSWCCQSILSNKHSCEKSGKTEILGHVFLAKSAPKMGIPSPPYPWNLLPNPCIVSPIFFIVFIYFLKITFNPNIQVFLSLHRHWIHIPT